MNNEGTNMETTTGIDKTGLKNLLRDVLGEILLDALRKFWKEEREQEKKPPAEILDVDEAAAFLKYKVTTLHEKTHKKLIPHYKKGNKLFFYRSELEAWLREGKVKTMKEMECEAITYTLTKRQQRKSA